MDLNKLIMKTRSVRRFRQSIRPSREDLLSFIESARFAPCGANLQLIRFSVISDPTECENLFPALNWAGYLHDWDGPAPEERPTGYIVIHAPVSSRHHIPVDAGIAASYIVLSAREAGYGSCMIMSFNMEAVSRVVGSPGDYNPFLVIALGKQNEEIVLEDAQGSIEYWRDAQGRHHVPKLDIDDIVI